LNYGAAYCLGVATQQIEIAQEHSQFEEKKLDSKLGRSGDSWVLDIFRNMNRDIHQSINERRDRFRDYLKAKGFLIARNIKKIEVPLRRGVADQIQCTIEVEDHTYERCRQQCGPMKEINDSYRCDSKCPPPPACTRVKRCLENFLPS
jgi:hypothetical protein